MESNSRTASRTNMNSECNKSCHYIIIIDNKKEHQGEETSSDAHTILFQS